MELAYLLGFKDNLDEIEYWIDLLNKGCEWLWNDSIGSYCARDIKSGAFSNATTNASMLSFFAGAGSKIQKSSMINHCHRILDSCKYGMPSWDPQHEEFESKRYWRGPVWLVMNHMIATGLQESGQNALAQRVRHDTYSLVENNGMAEYFDPFDGTGLGGTDFSWTAAIYLNQCNDEVAEILDTIQ